MKTSSLRSRLASSVAPCRAAFAAGALLLATISSADASPLFELVGGQGEQAGLSARVTGASAASTYFNPALLPRARPGFRFGVLVLSDQISIHLRARPAGADIPDTIGDAVHDVSYDEFATTSFPTTWLEDGCSTCPSELPARPRQAVNTSGNTTPYQAIGLVVPLWRERLVLGLHTLLPIGSFTTTHAFYNDEREQHFSNSLHPELYADRLKATSFAFGAGSQVHDRVALGVSFTLRMRNVASAPNFESGSGSLDNLLVASEVGVEISLAPHVGAVFSPHERVRIAATLHSPQSLDIETEFSTTVPNGSTDQSTKRFTHAYMPWTFGLGAEWDAVRRAGTSLGLAVSLKHARWSAYRDRHDEAPHIIQSVPACTTDAGGDTSCATRDLVFPAYRFANTFAPSLGVRYARPTLGAHFDVSWEPTPVPAATGRRNYVDNSRLGVSTGAEFAISLWGRPARVGAQVLTHYLVPREVDKNPYQAHPIPNPAERPEDDIEADSQVIDELPDDAVNRSTGLAMAGREGLQSNNPGWPGWNSEGWVFGGGVTLAVYY
jgi:hypothetical protein